MFDAGVLEIPSGSYGYFTMEYVAGASLQGFWRSHGTRFVPIETAIEIGRQVCRGLAVAHSEKPPIVHRDIKPQNILIGYDANGLHVRLSDFGLAKKANPLTLLVSARGTRCFKAPEAFRDFNSDSCAGDVWALGVTLYLLLTDTFPFCLPEETTQIKLECFLRPIVAPSRLNVMVDRGLEEIVLRTMSVDPQHRFPTASELLHALEQWTPALATATVRSTSARPVTCDSRAACKTSKEAMGPHKSPDEEQARKKVTAAYTLAREGGRLADAADLLEEALNAWPAARPQYEDQLRLWRRGIVM